MNPRTTSSYYAREAAAASRERGAAMAEASLFRALLAETDATLRAGANRSDDLIERTRAALAGEARRPMTVSEAVQAAADRLESESKERAQ